MPIEYGASVIDKNGYSLGKISRVIRDIWSGDIRSFAVVKDNQLEETIFTPNDVEDTAEQQIRLKVAYDKTD